MLSGRKQPGQEFLWELLATMLGNKVPDSSTALQLYCYNVVVVTFKA